MMRLVCPSVPSPCPGTLPGRDSIGRCRVPNFTAGTARREASTHRAVPR